MPIRRGRRQRRPWLGRSDRLLVPQAIGWHAERKERSARLSVRAALEDGVDPGLSRHSRAERSSSGRPVHRRARRVSSDRPRGHRLRRPCVVGQRAQPEHDAQGHLQDPEGGRRYRRCRACDLVGYGRRRGQHHAMGRPVRGRRQGQDRAAQRQRPQGHGRRDQGQDRRRRNDGHARHRREGQPDAPRRGGRPRPGQRARPRRPGVSGEESGAACGRRRAVRAAGRSCPTRAGLGSVLALLLVTRRRRRRSGDERNRGPRRRRWSCSTSNRCSAWVVFAGRCRSIWHGQRASIVWTASTTRSVWASSGRRPKVSSCVRCASSG